MPEAPDIEVYVGALRARVAGERVGRVWVVSPFVLRSFEPPVEEVEGKRVLGVERLGKRIVIGFEEELFVVLHLMIAGRLRWADGAAKRGAKAGKIELARFEFARGTLTMTEAGTAKRASMHVVRGRAGLRAHDPGGLEPREIDAGAFAARLRLENRTLKRALTDPVCFSGIGNAYSDEILHAAKLSPAKLTRSMSDEECTRLHEATGRVLSEWTARLREEFGDRFPGAGEITAFRPGFAAHGKFGEACPVCGVKIARIVRGEHETNYCPGCQTGGKVLADRVLSRLLKGDWKAAMESRGEGE